MNYHKLSGLKQHFVLVPEVRNLERVFWAKIELSAGLVPSEALGKNLFPCWCYLLEASSFLGLWPLLPPSEDITLTLASILTPPSLTLTLQTPS